MLRRAVTPTARRSGSTFLSDLPDGDYGIASHHPAYFLMPLEGDAASGRERYWSSLADYHEHRRPELQDTNARADTEVLVEEWLIPTAGGSFLELGCGAGRNLAALRRKTNALLYGLEINGDALAIAAEAVRDGTFIIGSLYDLSRFTDDSIDVVFTCGVLTHIPHERAEGVISEIIRIAQIAVVHFELHGDPRPYDFHRYPRDYSSIYHSLGVAHRYVVEPLTDGTGGMRGLLSTAV